jgi:hypothetical protein
VHRRFTFTLQPRFDCLQSRAASNTFFLIASDFLAAEKKRKETNTAVKPVSMINDQHGWFFFYAYWQPPGGFHDSFLAAIKKSTSGLLVSRCPLLGLVTSHV